MENQWTSVIAKIAYSAIAVITGAFGLGKYNANVVKKKELYHPDGSLIYMAAKDAKKCKEECHQMMNKVTEETNQKFDKIVGYMKEQNERHIQMTEFVGRVKQYMEGDK